MNEIEQLELFINRSEELRNTRAIKNGLNTQFKISWQKDKDLVMEHSQPNEEDLRSFLLLLRQFISETEPIFLNRIYNLCYKYIDDDEIKNGIIESRKIWKQSHINCGMGVILGNENFTPEYSTDLWINGYYFHNDEGKRKKLESKLHLERSLIRQQFFNYVISATENIFYISDMLKLAFKRNKIRR